MSTPPPAADLSPPPRFSWGADGVVLLVALTLPTLSTWLYFVVFAGQGELPKLIYGGSKLVQALLPLGWMWLRHREEIGWPRTSQLSWALGLAFGTLAFVCILWARAVWFRNDPRLTEAAYAIATKLDEFGLQSRAGFFAMAVFISFFHSAFEEYYWRWFVFGQLRKGMFWWCAAVVSAFGFMAHHLIVIDAYVPPGSFWRLTLPLGLCIAFAGFVWAAIYQRTGSLAGAWLAHAAADVALMFLAKQILIEAHLI